MGLTGVLALVSVFTCQIHDTCPSEPGGSLHEFISKVAVHTFHIHEQTDSKETRSLGEVGRLVEIVSLQVKQYAYAPEPCPLR